MTPTQNILRTFLLCSVGGLSILACAGPVQEGGNYCFNIDEGEECPSLETVNAERLPYEPMCSTIEYLEASEGPVQSDSPNSGMEPISVEEMDSCCYTATFREIRSEADCVLGRPLMQEGVATIAQVRKDISASWSKSLNKQISIHAYTKEQRERAGTFYLTSALYEHASIASFQKFTLDLMRFGAPPHLLDLAQQATRDEIDHARSAFAIAEELLQRPVQPGDLDYTPTLCSSLKEFALSTLREGAIGETLAVLMAHEQLQGTEDEMIQEFLKQVIEDEAKHAELAWETLRWCLQKDPSIRFALEEILREPCSLVPSMYPQDAIVQLGVPSQKSMKKVIEMGYERVIIPSIQSLLEA